GRPHVAPRPAAAHSVEIKRDGRIRREAGDCRAAVGLLCGTVLALLSWFLYGGGRSHGTSIPLLLSSAPLGVFALLGKLAGAPYVGHGYSTALLGAPFVWAALGSSAALSGRGSLRLFPILALLHYASRLVLVAGAGEEPARLQRLLRNIARDRPQTV